MEPPAHAATMRDLLDRLGIDNAFYETMGVRIPMIRMPVAPGRNVAILVEVAARNQLLAAALSTRTDRPHAGHS